MFLQHHIGADRGPADDFWYMDPNRGTAAGARVNAASAMQLSTVFKCVRAIAETMGMLPMPIYQRLDRGKQRSPDHPLAELLQVQPNPWQTAMQWRELMQGHASLLGNGYSEIVYNGAGRPEMLIPLHPTCTEVEVAPSGMPRYRTRDDNGKTRVLVFGQVLHLAGFATDSYRGLNPIEAEREAVGAGMAARDYGSRFFANNARPQTWIKMPPGVKFKDEEARRNFVRQFHENYGGSNSGRTPVFDQGIELHALSLSNSDAQWLESRKYSDVDICGLWRVPPHKIGIYDEAKWANVEQAALEWVSDCILPWCRRWEQMLQRDLDFGEGYFPEHLIAALLRGDIRTRYEAYGKGIQDGWLLRNEARELENLNALDGLDTPLEPMNMAPAGSRAADVERGKAPDSRALAVMTAAAERVARKEVAAMQRALKTDDPTAALAAFFSDHDKFVADVMAVDARSAQVYCNVTGHVVMDKLADGSLQKTLAADWTDRQVAALLRLED